MFKPKKEKTVRVIIDCSELQKCITEIHQTSKIIDELFLKAESLKKSQLEMPATNINLNITGSKGK